MTIPIKLKITVPLEQINNWNVSIKENKFKFYEIK